MSRTAFKYIDACLPRRVTVHAASCVGITEGYVEDGGEEKPETSNPLDHLTLCLSRH